MTTNQAKKKRAIAKEKLEIIAEWLSSDLLDDQHKQLVEDFKWSILGYFDAEITFAENTLRIEQNIIAQKQIYNGIRQDM